MEMKKAYLSLLAGGVEQNLTRFDPDTGRFMTGDGWAVTNQDIVYPLALLFTTQEKENPYYHDERILNYVVRGADAWRDFQNPDGSVEFIKPDGSTWGSTFMPWSMYHWLECYALVRDVLSPERRSRWEEGLTLAYTGIAKELKTGHVHNIPTWNGMAAYRAGEIFDRSDWKDRGTRMIELAVAAQTPQGYWKEHHGPTTSYNLVYVHAIGLYYFFSGDESVLPCLERATGFHIRYTYPDGTLVETIDGRVKYHDRVRDLAHAAFSLFPQGRRYVEFLVENMQKQQKTNAESGLSPRIATAYLYWKDGETAPVLQDTPSYALHDPDHALLRRSDGWFSCLSGIVTPKVAERWGQDRGNYVSLWNERTGLVVGGGNSKDQPDWNTFTSGKGKRVVYLPDRAELRQGDATDAVTLSYGKVECTVEVTIVDAGRVELSLSTGSPKANVTGHLIFHMHPGELSRTASGREITMDEEEMILDEEDTGGWIEHHKWRVVPPAGSRFTWPVLPFNPYAADGAAPISSAAMVLSIPLSDALAVVTIELV